MQNKGPENTSRNRSSILCLVIILLFVAFSNLNLLKEYYPRYDSAAFIITANSLAEGNGYTEMNNPFEPRFIHYPPALPVLLAVVIKIFGLKYWVMRAFIALLASASLLYLWKRYTWYFRDDEMPKVLLLSTVSLLFLFAGRIQSEAPYLLASLVSLKIVHDVMDKPQYNRWSLVKLFFALSIAHLVKAQGIVLCMTAFMWAILNWKSSPRARISVLLAAVAGIGLFLAYTSYQQPDWLDPSKSKVLLEDGWDYEARNVSLLSVDFIKRFAGNTVSGVSKYVPAALVPADLTQEFYNKLNFMFPVMTILGIFMTVGFIGRIIKGPTVVELYVALWGGLHFVTPWINESRLFVPLVPFLAGYFVRGIGLTVSGFARVIGRIRGQTESISESAGHGEGKYCSIFGIVPVAALILLNLYIIFIVRLNDPWGTKSNRIYNMAIVAKERTQPGDVVILHDHYGGHLVSGRKTFSYSPGEQKSLPGHNLNDYLDTRGRVDWLIVKKISREIDATIPALRKRGYTIERGEDFGSFILFKVEK